MTFVEENPKAEISNVARNIHAALSEQLEIVRRWKAGEIRFDVSRPELNQLSTEPFRQKLQSDPRLLKPKQID